MVSVAVFLGFPSTVSIVPNLSRNLMDVTDQPDQSQCCEIESMDLQNHHDILTKLAEPEKSIQTAVLCVSCAHVFPRMNQHSHRLNIEKYRSLVAAMQLRCHIRVTTE